MLQTVWESVVYNVFAWFVFMLEDIATNPIVAVYFAVWLAGFYGLTVYIGRCNYRAMCRRLRSDLEK